jgi:hypothetical protein
MAEFMTVIASKGLAECGFGRRPLSHDLQTLLRIQREAVTAL